MHEEQETYDPTTTKEEAEAAPDSKRRRSHEESRALRADVLDFVKSNPSMERSEIARRFDISVANLAYMLKVGAGKKGKRGKKSQPAPVVDTKLRHVGNGRSNSLDSFPKRLREMADEFEALIEEVRKKTEVLFL